MWRVTLQELADSNLSTSSLVCHHLPETEVNSPEAHLSLMHSLASSEKVLGKKVFFGPYSESWSRLSNSFETLNKISSVCYTSRVLVVLLLRKSVFKELTQAL